MDSSSFRSGTGILDDEGWEVGHATTKGWNDAIGVNLEDGVPGGVSDVQKRRGVGGVGDRQ